MRKMFLATCVAAAMVFGFCAPASAQKDHWSTVDQCVAATAAPYYYPTIVHRQAPANDEVAQGRPTPSCIDMTLPDRLGGRGWVRVGDDRKIIFSRTTGKPLRLAECNNQIFAIVALPPTPGTPGPQGPQGVPGPPGPQGPQGVQGVPPAQTMAQQAVAIQAPPPPVYQDQVPGFFAGLATGCLLGPALGILGGSYGGGYPVGGYGYVGGPVYVGGRVHVGSGHHRPIHYNHGSGHGGGGYRPTRGIPPGGSTGPAYVGGGRPPGGGTGSGTGSGGNTRRVR